MAPLVNNINIWYKYLVKRLYKSEKDRKIDGVCAGFAEYFEIDPTIVRAGYAFVTIITGILPGLVAYIALMIIMPKESEIKK